MKNGMLILSVALTLLANPAQAQVSVNWGAQTDNGLGTAGGAELPIGDLIRIGTFNLTDTQIQQNQFNISLLNSSFIEYATAAIGDDVLVPAHWNTLTQTPTGTLGGRQIYLWAFDAPSLGAATEQGIFTSTNPSWVFPSDSALPPANSIIIDLDQVAHQVGPGAIVVGGFGNGTTTVNNVQYPLYNLTPVPEPSAYAAVFGVICLASAVWFRRLRGQRNLTRGSCV